MKIIIINIRRLGCVIKMKYLINLAVKEGPIMACIKEGPIS